MVRTQGPHILSEISSEVKHNWHTSRGLQQTVPLIPKRFNPWVFSVIYYGVRHGQLCAQLLLTGAHMSPFRKALASQDGTCGGGLESKRTGYSCHLLYRKGKMD
eukprot:743321-Pelagomonas_calceolata.AAC.1